MDDELCTYEQCLIPYERFRRWSELVNELISKGNDYKNLVKFQGSLGIIQKNPVQNMEQGQFIDFATDDIAMAMYWTSYDPQYLIDELTATLDTPQSNNLTNQ